MQRTIKEKVDFEGVGLHSGVTVSISLIPAKADSGIVFIRKDVQDRDNKVVANYNNVADTRLGTTIANSTGISVSTIEHLMAAIWSCDIDNLVIEINAHEVPIMDGSAKPFVSVIESAGTVEQDKPRKFIKILKEVKIEEPDKSISIAPSEGFSIEINIDFDSEHVGKQSLKLKSPAVSFKEDISGARTFCFEKEIDAMREIGLAKGGSLDNAIVIGDEGVLNKNGLHWEDELVRHKILDCLGDMYLAGHLIGRVKGYKSGHGVNNQLLRKLFDDDNAWEIVHKEI